MLRRSQLRPRCLPRHEISDGKWVMFHDFNLAQMGYRHWSARPERKQNPPRIWLLTSTRSRRHSRFRLQPLREYRVRARRRFLSCERVCFITTATFFSCLPNCVAGDRVPLLSMARCRELSNMALLRGTPTG